MQWLPKDIILIVYRYLHVYNYRAVITQYKIEWVKEDRTDDWGMHWCETCMCFELNETGLANWRPLRHYSRRSDDLGVIRREISRFYNRGLTLHYLPTNYVHQILYK